MENAIEMTTSIVVYVIDNNVLVKKEISAYNDVDLTRLMLKYVNAQIGSDLSNYHSIVSPAGDTLIMHENFFQNLIEIFPEVRTLSRPIIGFGICGYIEGMEGIILEFLAYRLLKQEEKIASIIGDSNKKNRILKNAIKLGFKYLVEDVKYLAGLYNLSESAEGTDGPKVRIGKKQKFLTDSAQDQSQCFWFSWKALCYFRDNSSLIKSMLADLGIDSEENIVDDGLMLQVSNECLEYLSYLFENDDNPNIAHLYFEQLEDFKKGVIYENIQWLGIDTAILQENFSLKPEMPAEKKSLMPKSAASFQAPIDYISSDLAFERYTHRQKFIANAEESKARVFEFSWKALCNMRDNSNLVKSVLEYFGIAKEEDITDNKILPLEVNNHCLEFLQRFFEKSQADASVYFGNLEPDDKHDLLFDYFPYLELSDYFLLSNPN